MDDLHLQVAMGANSTISHLLPNLSILSQILTTHRVSTTTSLTFMSFFFSSIDGLEMFTGLLATEYLFQISVS